MPQAGASPPAALRRYSHPEPGDDWDLLAQRHLPDLDASEAVATLQSWNLHLVTRPPTVAITPLDLLFLEPPRPN